MTPDYQDSAVTLWHGDALDVLRSMPSAYVQTCITSPPYWGLRDYGEAGQMGLESTPEKYVANLVAVFREVRRVLRDDGTLWLNLGDSYAGSWSGNSMRPGGGTQREGGPGFQPLDSRVPARGGNTPLGLKPKDIVGIPWRVAFALQADGWYLRSDIIWSKPNPMPESVTDRPTKSHEYIFLLSKNARYYYDAEAIKEPAVYSGIAGMDGSGFKDPQSFNGKHRDAAMFGKRTAVEGPDSGKRNRRSVWEIATQPYPEAHFATFPVDLVKPCVLAGSPAGGMVLDPFAGSGTACFVAKELGRQAIGIDLKAEYLDLAAKRLRQEVLAL